MLKYLRTLIQERHKPPEAHTDPKNIAASVCGLLYEAAKADMELGEKEKERIDQIMMDHFKLQPEEYRDIKNQAANSKSESTEVYRLTKNIRKDYTIEERRDVLKLLWQVVLTDDVIHPYEEQLMRTIYHVIGLEHSDFVETKLIAMQTSTERTE